MRLKQGEDKALTRVRLRKQTGETASTMRSALGWFLAGRIRFWPVAFGSGIHSECRRWFWTASILTSSPERCGSSECWWAIAYLQAIGLLCHDDLASANVDYVGIDPAIRRNRDPAQLLPSMALCVLDVPALLGQGAARGGHLISMPFGEFLVIRLGHCVWSDPDSS